MLTGGMLCYILEEEHARWREQVGPTSESSWPREERSVRLEKEAGLSSVWKAGIVLTM